MTSNFGGWGLGARLDLSVRWNFRVEHLSHIVGPLLWAPEGGCWFSVLGCFRCLASSVRTVLLWVQ